MVIVLIAIGATTFSLWRGKRNTAVTVTTPAGSRLIANVPSLGWGMKDVTFAAALESATAVTDRPLTYGQVLGFSGVGMRARWYRSGDAFGWGAHDGQWGETSAANAGHPDDVEPLQGVSGWNLRVVHRPERGPGSAEPFVADVVRSIDAGIPVLTWYPRGEDFAVIHGYEDNGKTLVLYDFDPGAARSRVPAADANPVFVFLTPADQPPDPRAATLSGLRAAVREWHRGSAAAGDVTMGPPRDPRATFYYGPEAYDRWIDDLADTGKLTDAQRDSLFAQNWWVFDCLNSARRATAEQLRAAIGELRSDAARAHVTAAADLYDQMAETIGTSTSMGGPGHPVAFQGPWSRQTVTDWTDAVRAHERKVLTALSDLDVAAMAEIEKAVAAEETGASLH